MGSYSLIIFVSVEGRDNGHTARVITDADKGEAFLLPHQQFLITVALQFLNYKRYIPL